MERAQKGEDILVYELILSPEQTDDWRTTKDGQGIGCWYEEKGHDSYILKCDKGFAAVYGKEDSCRIVYATESEDIDRLFEEFLEKRAQAHIREAQRT